ncbi:MAG: hypothetical protein BA862_02705 [Desulfobulbaceae bacterium S3730MH12]|nr:MAG: hypothetical protein BA862_02705 [Desulfobulbaceae bacterium S3730MH12]
MKTIRNITTISILSLAMMLVPPSLFAENAPREVGGIVLGSRIDTYPDIIQSNFMKEVVVTDRHGFRKGVISYGVCKYDGEILKIRLKYEDKSKSFYKTLLKKYRKKYGAPDSWKGDSFGMLRVWKWYFIDKDKNRVSLNLQYNAKDPDETMGSVVKLSYPDRIEEERICFMQMCDEAFEQTDEKRREELKKSDWSHLIPR